MCLNLKIRKKFNFLHEWYIRHVFLFAIVGRISVLKTDEGSWNYNVSKGRLVRVSRCAVSIERLRMLLFYVESEWNAVDSCCFYSKADFCRRLKFRFILLVKYSDEFYFRIFPMLFPYTFHIFPTNKKFSCSSFLRIYYNNVSYMVHFAISY